MNRGRHKKCKKYRDFSSIEEICNFVRDKLLILLERHKSSKTIDYAGTYAYLKIINLATKDERSASSYYISDMCWVNEFLFDVARSIDRKTTLGVEYIIHFKYGSETKEFKYKR